LVALICVVTLDVGSAIPYWLRDLGLEGYSLNFAQRLFLSFDQVGASDNGARTGR
jgi:hypothetical protein